MDDTTFFDPEATVAGPGPGGAALAPGRHAADATLGLDAEPSSTGGAPVTVGVERVQPAEDSVLFAAVGARPAEQSGRRVDAPAPGPAPDAHPTGPTTHHAAVATPEDPASGSLFDPASTTAWTATDTAAPPAPVASPVVGRPAGSQRVRTGRVPRRVVEIAVAAASIIAVAGVIGYAATRGGADGVDGEGGLLAAEGGEGTLSSALGPEDGSNGGRGQFVPGGPSGPAATTDTTDASGTTPTTTGPTEPTTPEPTTTTTEEPVTTTTEDTTTTTEEPVTTTTEDTTTTTEDPTPAPTPIAIVSGPTVTTKGPTSFHFNYTTNDVCGTGSFTVIDKDSGTVIGSYTGEDICYGPLHGGFPQPSHPTFGGFHMTPETTYVVKISVRGTDSDGTKPAGTGTATTSFEVTTTP